MLQMLARLGIGHSLQAFHGPLKTFELENAISRAHDLFIVLENPLNLVR